MLTGCFSFANVVLAFFWAHRVPVEDWLVDRHVAIDDKGARERLLNGLDCGRFVLGEGDVVLGMFLSSFRRLIRESLDYQELI